MNLKLPASISSPQDLKAIMLEIRQYSRWFAHADVKKRVGGGAASEPPVISPAAASLVQELGSSKPLSQASLDGLAEALEVFAAKAPQITITLAAMPSDGLKKTLITWCRQHIAPDILVTFRFNSTLLGGMVVRYGSRVFDWSFRRQILAARGKFPEVLRHV
ncbi:MAG TPA: F0F1 ATP synthase subunit delta [Candidatus Dormibacteraeota bacterium]|nr:F0F1 ATP synthase subunit delta [Candidatus Dormibacteraeota bacterium]